MMKTAITTMLLLTTLSFSAFAQKMIQVENKKVLKHCIIVCYLKFNVLMDINLNNLLL